MKKTNEYTVKVLPGSFKNALSGTIFNLNETLQNRMDEIAKIFKRGGAKVIDRDEEDEDN